MVGIGSGQVGVLTDSLDNLREEGGIIIVEEVESEGEVLSQRVEFSCSEALIFLSILYGVSVLINCEELGSEALSSCLLRGVDCGLKLLISLLQVGGRENLSHLDFVFLADKPSLNVGKAVIIRVGFIHKVLH
jgi:hypothetical protein